MARPQKWPPTIHVTPNGTSYIRVMIAGRRQEIALGPSGSEQARAKYARLLAELQAGHVAGPKIPDATVRLVVLQWLETAPRRYRPDSREPKEFRYAVAPLLKLYGGTQAADFGPKALKAVRQAMVDDSLSRRVVNRRVTRLKTLFKWAAEEELIPGNTYQNLRAVRALPPQAPGVKETAGVPTTTWDQVKAVYRHCPRGPGAMLLVQWLTGMRSQEVRLLRPCDIDTSQPVWCYCPHRHKNLWRGQGREVPLGPKVQAILRRWLRLAPTPSAYLFDPRHETRGRAAKDHYTDSAYGLAIGRAAERAGVSLRPYSCRHGHKDTVSRTLGAEAARSSLGQKTLDATQLYGARDYALAAEVARRCG